MSQTLHLKAYAKVNLGLDVIRRREDGYHEVRMIMQTVRLFDRLSLTKNQSGQITLSVNLPYLPVNEKNLVYRAIDIIRKNYHISEGIHADINKRIPVAAGMAGGSSDAAAAFVGMNQMFDLGISQETLMEYAVGLGADIPYCIMRGTALSEGIGEKLTPLPPMPDCWFLIVKPVFSMSTRFVYENLRLDESTCHPDIDGMVAALKNQDLTGITDRMGNVLEQVTQEHFPQIREIKDCMRQEGALNALMSGSGSTVFSIFTSRKAAEAAGRVCRDRFQIKQTAVVCPFNKPHVRSRILSRPNRGEQQK
ncbi:MAG: 4-(cytidine 5'-diphospho)-2-C-methyl-D-erythritol kinase [Eubacterium sp.]|nr:4-(cytidine 5'-diphospho)-2-C-methyl-D-erythritol kinase [Eubacterium sp.]